MNEEQKTFSSYLKLPEMRLSFALFNIVCIVVYFGIVCMPILIFFFPPVFYAVFVNVFSFHDHRKTLSVFSEYFSEFDDHFQYDANVI